MFSSSSFFKIFEKAADKVLHSRFFITGLAFILVLGMTGVRFSESSRTFEEIRLRLFDSYIRLNPSQQTPALPVGIVDVDEKSLKALGQFPWPRNIIADILESMADYGVAAVGMDIIFPEFDNSSPRLLAKNIKNLDLETQFRLRSIPDNEFFMQKAMQRMPTVLGLANSRLEENSVRALNLPSPKIISIGRTKPGDFIRRNHFFGLLGNVKPLNEAASGFGVFSLATDVDGIIRRIPMVIKVQDRIFPSLSLEVLRVGLRSKNALILTDEHGIRGARIQSEVGDIFIPTDEEGVAWVYFGEPDAFDTPDNTGRFYVSAVDILNKTVPAERMKNAFMLFGTSATGLKDLRNTPVHTSLPGVEVHANLLSNALSNEYLQPIRNAALIEASLILFLGLLVVFITRQTRFFVSAGIIALIILSNIAVSWNFFTQKGFLYDTSLFTLTLIGVFIIITVGNYIRESGEKKQIRRAFGQYLSPDLVNQVSKNPEQLVLGGELREMTFLFCDVRGFTSISEGFKTNPKGLTTLVNRLLTPLSNEILTRKGTIDKYMGDCIMAFWNAPLDDADHARNAAFASLEMFKSLKILNVAREAEAKEAGEKFLELRVGIGINTGEAVVGNMGSEQRFDYSVLGDPVNLASRLEGQSKTYGVDVVIGEKTNRYLDSFATLELDLIAVKGKDEAVRIFALLGKEDFVDNSEFQNLLKKHQIFLDAYRNQEWEKAKKLMQECTPMLGEKMAVLYALYQERIDAFTENPPGKDWDGVYRATTK